MGRPGEAGGEAMRTESTISADGREVTITASRFGTLSEATARRLRAMAVQHITRGAESVRIIFPGAVGVTYRAKPEPICGCGGCACSLFEREAS